MIPLFEKLAGMLPSKGHKKALILEEPGLFNLMIYLSQISFKQFAAGGMSKSPYRFFLNLANSFTG
jgi:hypothetical protein